MSYLELISYLCWIVLSSMCLLWEPHCPKFCSLCSPSVPFAQKWTSSESKKQNSHSEGFCWAETPDGEGSWGMCCWYTLLSLPPCSNSPYWSLMDPTPPMMGGCPPLHCELQCSAHASGWQYSSLASSFPSFRNLCTFCRVSLLPKAVYSSS